MADEEDKIELDLPPIDLGKIKPFNADGENQPAEPELHPDENGEYPWHDKVCGDCDRLRVLKPEMQVRLSGGNLRAPPQGDCFGMPPTPVVVGAQQMPNGQAQPVIVPVQPRVPVHYHACRLWKPRQRQQEKG